MDKYPILKKSPDENRAEFTFKSKGDKEDMNIISVASEQAYRNKLNFSFFQDDFGKISICLNAKIYVFSTTDNSIKSRIEQFKTFTSLITVSAFALFILFCFCSYC